jgi:hypothetical protein
MVTRNGLDRQRLQNLDALVRMGTVADYVAGADETIDPQGPKCREHSTEGMHVGMYVGNHR